jgi:DNA-binding CsgD family transcriptional regulator
LCDQVDISALDSFGFTDLQKKIVKMKYFDGLPVDQISIKVRLHPSTINDSLESIKRKVQNAFIKWSIWKDLSNIDWHAEYEKVTGRKYKHAGELGQIAEMFYKNLMSPPTIASILNSDPATVRKKIKKIQKILANL